MCDVVTTSQQYSASQFISVSPSFFPHFLTSHFFSPLSLPPLSFPFSLTIYTASLFPPVSSFQALFSQAPSCPHLRFCSSRAPLSGSPFALPLYQFVYTLLISRVDACPSSPFLHTSLLHLQRLLPLSFYSEATHGKQD